MAILIADSGSTKTDWVLLEQHHILKQCQTIGFSPYFQTSQQISDEIKSNLLPHLQNHISDITHIYYYGTGCSTNEKKDIITLTLNQAFASVPSEINHDLLASARALCGHEKGIACILGTGSNSCLYDGKNITENVESYGYLFGDHGSGAVIGKTLVQHYFDNKLPQTIREAFEKEGHNRESILDQVYKKPMPNRYLASLCLFIAAHQTDVHIKQLISTCFEDFFKHQVSQYTNAKQLPINAVGSVAYHFKEQFNEVAKQQGYQTGTIIKSPIDGLITYHNSCHS